jgi:hypothetical protein
MGKRKRKTGYLTRKKAKGQVYIYLRKTFSEGNKIRNQNIYSFGRMPGALESMYQLRENPDSFPEELLKAGYNLDDLDEWILTIETQVTSSGRSFKL